AGGAKYSNTALSLLGVGTFADSLFSVKTLVFDEKKLNLKELNAVLKADYEGSERLRQYILNRIPKFGTGRESVDSFANEVLADISKMFGQKNGRGGDYLPAIYPHDIFRNLGRVCGATPDGRKSGEYLSRGCSPSEFVEVRSPLDIMQSLGKIDLTNYAESVCAEITLPKLSDETGKTAFKALVASFIENGGSSLQFNLVDKELLMEAQKHPEHHGDIIVRVCGYSAVFVALDEERQDEVISRAVREG
ncbi:MAG: glycyl radical protein, partial [Clostridia bacterium]|nr:glycyl radical protein [Clostridia bacterium]